MGEEALHLTELGFRVFPVWAPVDGVCSCKTRDCDATGKHPHLTRYLMRATTDPTQVTKWWKSWPDANIGIATGNGLVVVDEDGDEGREWLEDRDLPPTLMSTTGRGCHRYYLGDAKGGIAIGPKVDVLGPGRWVVGPPSLHKSGRRYTWLTSKDTPIAKAPAWVYEERAKPLRSTTTKAPAKTPGSQTPPDVYREGKRNEMLFLDACLMARAARMSEGEIRAALAVTNQQRCQPPLPESEIAAISKSAHRRASQQPDYRDIVAMGFTPSETAVVLVLLAEMNAMGEVTMSYPVLAKKAGISERTAQRVETALEKAHVISKKRTAFRSNRYVIRDVTTWRVNAREREEL